MLRATANRVAGTGELISIPSMKARSSLVAVIALLVSPVFAQQDFSKVEIKTTPVRGNVYMLEGRGGNIGV